MKEAYINAKILDPEKNKEFVGDIIIEKSLGNLQLSALRKDFYPKVKLLLND